MATQKSVSASGGTARTLVRVRGRLADAVVRAGSASEHESWVLESPEHGRLILTRLGSNPFEKGDPPAEPGSEVEAEGYLLDHELRFTSLKRL